MALITIDEPEGIYYGGTIAARWSEIYLRIYFLIWELRQYRKKLLYTFPIHS